MNVANFSVIFPLSMRLKSYSHSRSVYVEINLNTANNLYSLQDYAPIIKLQALVLSVTYEREQQAYETCPIVAISG